MYSSHIHHLTTNQRSVPGIDPIPNTESYVNVRELSELRGSLRVIKSKTNTNNNSDNFLYINTNSYLNIGEVLHARTLP